MASKHKYTKTNHPKNLESQTKKNGSRNKVKSKKNKISFLIVFLVIAFTVGSFGTIFPQIIKVSANLFNYGYSRSKQDIVLDLDFRQTSTFSSDRQNLINAVNNFKVATLGDSPESDKNDPKETTEGLKFSGNQYLQIDKELAPKNDFTFSIWLKADEVSTNSYIISNTSKDSGKSSVGLKIQDDHWWYFGSNNNKKVYIPFPDDYISSEWHHLVITRVDTKISIYLDSKEASVSREVNKYTINSDYFTLGAEITGSGGQSFFDGTISELRVYNAGLSGDEIKHEFDLNKQKYSKN
jgi:hypothetical protein